MERKENNRRDARSELESALAQRFYAILRVEPARNTVFILQSRDLPQSVDTEMDWDDYLERYSRILTSSGRERLFGEFSARALLKRGAGGEGHFSFDLPYLKGAATNWVTVAAVFGRREGGELYADLFVRQSNEEHMLRSIIDTYVYDSCDYFVCLDVHHDSYVIFSGSKLEKRRLSSFGSGYERAMVEYANSYVVPEEREPLIRKMRLEQVVKQLNDREVYSLTAGVEDPERGYTRKQLTYRYYDRPAGMVLLCRTDVTEIYLEERARQKELEAARARAERDPLTGLLNYGGFSRRTEELLERGAGLSALLVLDLDDFKLVNDTLGHLEGDRLLWKVAQVLQLQSGEESLQGRVGGDEFVVFLHGLASRGRAADCARQICEAVNCLTLPESAPHAVSCSIGGAFGPEEGADYQTLFRTADRRAYEAKRRGKNCYLLEG